MAKSSKKIQKQQFINWASKMDDRSNSEVVNLNPDENGITFEYLENADLYYSKALRNRKGTQDLCCGIVNETLGNTCVYDTTSGLSTSGSTIGYTQVNYLSATLLDFPVTLVIPSGDMALTQATLRVLGSQTPASYLNLVNSGERDYDIQIQAHLFEVNCVPVSGSVISGNSQTYDISLSGTFTVPPYPEYVSQITPNPINAIPIASATKNINLGTYALQTSGTFSGNYTTSTQEVELDFDTPAFLYSGSVYGVRFDYVQTSGNAFVRNVYAETISNPSTDLNSQSVLLEEFQYGGAPANQNYALRKNITTIGPEKTWMYGKLCFQDAVAFLNPDYRTANNSYDFPILSGTTPVGQRFPWAYNVDYRQSANMAQVISISGQHVFYGAYNYIGPNSRTNSVLYQNGVAFSGSENVGVWAGLYQIDTATGSLASGNYTVTGKTLLAESSGNYVIDHSESTLTIQGYPQDYQRPNYNLNKNYLIFDNPVTVSGTGQNYMLAFGLYDVTDGSRYKTYLRNTDSPANPYNISAIRFGGESQTEAGYFGQMLVEQTGVYIQTSGAYSNPFVCPSKLLNVDLTCGSIEVPSGNAVVGIYDYRVGEDRVSNIVYGQGGEIRWFDLDTPCKDTHTTIFSGLSTETNALMTFETYDDMMFTHQYSQISGQCWNQTYPSTMIHGLRPTGVFNYTSGTGAGGAVPSGVPFSLMVANEYSSGGYRTTIYENLIASGVSVSGNNNWIEVSGLANQFKFDVPASHMYLFVTEASGANYYLATVRSGSSNSSAILNYPLPSGTDVVYIERLADATTDESFSRITDYPINYALSQTDTPKFKKIEVFYDYMLGIGDPEFPSRLWYSEQYAPQIWGESFDFHGFIDVDKDSGSPLVAMARLRDYMMLFKKNSTYRVEFLGDNAQPFSITQVSSKIGSLGVFGVVSVGDTVYGLSEYGIFATNGATVEIISDPIDPFFRTIDHNDLLFTTVVHDMHEDKIIWSISNDNSSPDRNYGIMFNYKEGSFSIRQGAMWNYGATVFDDDSFDVLLGGDVLGQIQVLEVDNVDTTTVFSDGNLTGTKSISCVAETPWMSVLDSQIKKEFRYIDFNIEQADALLKVDVYFDEDSVNKRYTRYINLNQANPDKRVHLGGKAKTIKFVFTNVGNPAFVKIKSMNMYFTPLGIYEEM